MAEDLSRNFSIEDTQTHANMFKITNHKENTNQNFEILPIPIGVAIIKKTTNIKCWQGYGEKDTIVHYWNVILVPLLWKSVWRFLKELKIELLYNPEIPLLGTYLKKMKTT